jgi:hypothetical protein
MADKTVATPAANANASVSALNMASRGVSDSMPAMATAMSAVTTAMSSTSVHWWRHYQKSRHHKRSKC